MIKIVTKNACKYSFLPITGLFGSADKLDNATSTEIKTDKIVAKNETGWDRVKKIFEIDEFDNVSYEANSVLEVSAMSMFIGAIYGGVISSRVAYMEFMRNNQATSFRSHFEAKQKLQEKVAISFGKGAFKWGWRLTLFTTTFVGIATIIQTYRGKCGLLEYITAGGISGAMYKFNMGPRGWIVGGGLGSALGLTCGGITMALLKLTGLSMEEARYWQYHWKDARKEYYRKGMADYLEKEDFAVIRLHDDEIGEEGRDISNLDKDKNSTGVNKQSVK